MYSLIVYGSL